VASTPTMCRRTGAPGSLVGRSCEESALAPIPDEKLFDDMAVRAARRVSLFSVCWTVTVGVAAIAIGVLKGSTALSAFGAIGLVDAVGSVALAHHFRPGPGRSESSDRSERAAHRIATEVPSRRSKLRRQSVISLPSAGRYAALPDGHIPGNARMLRCGDICWKLASTGIDSHK